MKSKHPRKMTDAQFKAAIFAATDDWAKNSNDPVSQTQNELSTECEQFIGVLYAAITAAGGHPEDPPPRIRP